MALAESKTKQNLYSVAWIRQSFSDSKGGLDSVQKIIILVIFCG